MMTEHREPSIRSSRSTSTAKPPGSASIERDQVINVAMLRA